MLDDYIEKFYTPESKRVALLKANDYAKAKEIAAWKQKIAENWDNIVVESVKVGDQGLQAVEVGKSYSIDIVLDVKNLDDNGIGTELVVTYIDEKNRMRILETKELQLVKREGSRLFYSAEYQTNHSGSYKYAFRMFPKNEMLPHRMDFCYVRWFE